MVQYHERKGNLEICDLNCEKAITDLKSTLYKIYKEIIPLNFQVSKYDKEISSDGEMTYHYRTSRMSREKELEEILGKGGRLQAFLVDKGDGDIQIQELLDNGLLIIYSYCNHKKITLFAPKPERIKNLYFSIGEIAPESIIRKSEENVKKGYHIVYFE